MQSLLSKDLLYPAMKELAEKVSDAICILLIFSSLDVLLRLYIYILSLDGL